MFHIKASTIKRLSQQKSDDYLNLIRFESSCGLINAQIYETQNTRFIVIVFYNEKITGNLNINIIF